MQRFAISIIGLCFLFACAGSPSSPAPGDIAATYQSAGRLQEAAREIELAVRVRPRDIALRRQAAQIYTEADRADRAIEHLEAAIQLTPNSGSSSRKSSGIARTPPTPTSPTAVLLRSLRTT